jgi:streptomycin 6-kinase
MHGPGHAAGRPAYDDHAGLQWLRTCDAGRAWLAGLGRLVDECARRWGLTLGPPFAHAYTSLTMPVVISGETPAVLKIQFPDPETEHEARALAHWRGDGAVGLLEADAERRALLLERCVPGAPLYDVHPPRALQILVGLVARLSVPAGPPFRTLAEEAGTWGRSIRAHWEEAGRPFERRLVDAAYEYLTALPGSQGEQVLLHQDLHAGNVLSARREPWLAIDPKPLVGEREFGVAPIVRGSELGHSPTDVRTRLDALASELGLDRERARGWTVVQTLAWAFSDDGVLAHHVEVVRWLLEDS